MISSVGGYRFKYGRNENAVCRTKASIVLQPVHFLALFLHSNNLSHYCTQKATAFLSPSAAVFAQL